MIFDAIKLFKARKDSELAKQIASEMIVDGAIEKLGYPITIAKLLMAGAIILLGVFIIGFLWVGIKFHWTAAIPAPLFGGIIYGIIRLWGGLNKGVQIVTDRAKLELGDRASSMGKRLKRVKSKETVQDESKN